MKKLTYALLSTMLLLLVAVGCSKSADEDALSLLRTVPADASSVVMVNVANAVEKLGGSTDGSKIKLSKEFQATIDESQALRDEYKQALKDICNGETGVAISNVVFFSAARSYVTGMVNDPKKLVEYLQKNTGSNVSEEDGAKVIGKVAIIGNQFWVCTSGTPDPEQLKYYQQLNEKQSYASSDAAKLLLEPGKVIAYVADVNRTIAYIPNAAAIKMVSSLIFDDLVYVAGSADIKGKIVTANASVLNSEMKPAELLIPIDKIDDNLIKSFSKGGDLFIAAAMPKKLTKMIADKGSTLWSKDNMILKAISAIDGTVVARANSGIQDGEILVQTTGQNFSEFSTVISNFLGLTVSRDGDLLKVTKGTSDFNGDITPEQAADKLKGAWIGVVSNGMIVRDLNSVAKVSADKKSLRLDIEADGGLDALITMYLR